MSTRKQTIIITGSGRGIGKAMAFELLSAGHNVVINARNKEKLEAVKRELDVLPGTCLAIAADVSVFKECEALVAQTVATFGGLDALYNNAGISAKGTVADMDPEVYDRVIDINLKGAFYMAKAALEPIKKSKGGILFTGSLAGIHGIGYYSAYSSSKMALKGLVNAMRIENQSSGVYVGLALVGFTENDSDKTLLDETGKEILQHSRKGIKPETTKVVASRLIRMMRKRTAFKVFTLPGKLKFTLEKWVPGLVHALLSNAFAKNKA